MKPTDVPLSPEGHALAKWLYGADVDAALSRPLFANAPADGGGAVIWKHPVNPGCYPQGYPYDFIWLLAPDERLPTVAEAAYVERFAIDRAHRSHSNASFNIAAMRRAPGT
jgi:hypothetical protein